MGRRIFFSLYSTIQALIVTLFFKIKAKADPLVTRSSNTTYFLILLLVLRIAGSPPRPLFFIQLRILLYLFLAKFSFSAILLIIIARISIFIYLNIIRIGVIVGCSQQRMDV